jgi:phosphoglycolate phosphatase-like HAD superfamily hydrolase
MTLFKNNGHARYQWITDLYTGDVGSGNIIKQIFQEIYLGKDLFESTYGTRPQVYSSEGYIDREKCLVDPSVLEDLSQNHVLAIATGRPAAEALYPLNLFGLKQYFTQIFTLDDCLKEEQKIRTRECRHVSLSKPNPFMLDAIAKRQADKAMPRYYVGDMPDDMLAASRANATFAGIGMLVSSLEKEVLKNSLMQAGADYVVDDFDQLKAMVNSGVKDVGNE